MKTFLAVILLLKSLMLRTHSSHRDHLRSANSGDNVDSFAPRLTELSKAKEMRLILMAGRRE